MSEFDGTYWQEFDDLYGHVRETKVKRLMKQLGITPKMLIEQSGDSKGTVYAILAGNKPMTQDIAERWAPILFTTAENLLIED